MPASTLEVGRQLVQLCKQNRHMDAVNSLYSPTVVSIEPKDGPGFPALVEGIDAVREKNEWWAKNHQVHRCEVAGPWPHGECFVATFKYDVTGKSGPMAGKRMTIDEAALYTVEDGKIVKEEFFYDMGK